MQIRKPTLQADGEYFSIKYLELLNLLPSNIDVLLKTFSKTSREFQIKHKRIRKYQKVNRKRTAEGKELTLPSNEERQKLMPPSITEVKKLYAEIYEQLPKKLQDHLEVFGGDGWSVGETLLNMMSVERESLNLIISENERVKEFEKDFEDWKQNTFDPEIKLLSDDPQASTPLNLSEKELRNRFAHEMKSYSPTISKYNSEKYRTPIPSLDIILLLPHIDQLLYYHRVASGVERQNFKGFLTRLTAADKGKYLGVRAEGLAGILLKNKFSGGASIEIDRLRNCALCLNLIYAYKGDKQFCSTRCYSNYHKQSKRNDKISLLEKTLKRMNHHLEVLKQGLDAPPILIIEQKRKIENIKKQILKEQMKNGNL